jgi:DNA-binding MarR family transcriptional regulator
MTAAKQDARQLNDAMFRVLDAIFDSGPPALRLGDKALIPTDKKELTFGLRFTDIRETTLLSKDYLASILDDLEKDGWIKHDSVNKIYRIPQDRLPVFMELQSKRFGFLYEYSKVILPLAKSIRSIQDKEDRAKAYSDLFTQFMCATVRESLYAISWLKHSRTRRKAFEVVKSTHFNTIPNTLNILTHIALTAEEITPKMLSEVAQKVQDVEWSAGDELARLMGKYGLTGPESESKP